MSNVLPASVADAVFAAMDAILDSTPDAGHEGCTYHLRSQTAWEIRQDYMEADPSVWEGDLTPDQVRAMCVRDAATAIRSWLAEDKS